ncbi:MAG: glycosyltransferase family 4 protein [Chloroflexaceae bacterium]|nr:glycosyltransferase family 4 protein [Chloroflexaceae bacterium]
MQHGRALRVLIVGLGGVTQTFRHWPERVLALALVRRGHHVFAIGTHDPQRPALAQTSETIDGVEVVRVPRATVPIVRWHRRLMRC